LAWSQRCSQIVEMLGKTEADVICLQEVSCEEGPDGWGLPAWMTQLDGYRSVMQGLSQKELSKTAQRNQRICGRAVPTCVVTLYRSDTLEEYTNAKHPSGSGTVLFLRSLQPPAKADDAPFEVAVGNLHLTSEPSKSAEHVKFLASQLKNMGSHGHHVICGDFNGACDPDSEVGRWIGSNYMWDVPTGTSWAEPGNAMRLDHILISSGLKAVAASGPLSPAEVESGLPCATCPSDHAPIRAVLSGQPAVVRKREKCPW